MAAMSSLEDDDVELKMLAEEPAPVKRKLSRLRKVGVRKHSEALEAAEAVHKQRSPEAPVVSQAAEGNADPAAVDDRQMDAEDPLTGAQPSASADEEAIAGSDAEPAEEAADARIEGDGLAASGATDGGGSVSDSESEGGGSDADEGEQPGYWDEEDEMLMDLQREGDDTPAPSGTAEVGGEEGGDVASAGSPADGKHLNAQTQRILRETAERDRIGRGHNPEIAPLSGILAKLKAQRAALTARRKKPPPLRRRSPPPAAAAAAEAEQDDDILLLSDEEEDAALPVAATSAMARSAAGGSGAAPMEDTQGLELELNLPSASQSGGGGAHSQPSLHLTLDSQTQQDELDMPPQPQPAVTTGTPIAAAAAGTASAAEAASAAPATQAAPPPLASPGKQAAQKPAWLEVPHSEAEAGAASLAGKSRSTSQEPSGVGARRTHAAGAAAAPSLQDGDSLPDDEDVISDDEAVAADSDVSSDDDSSSESDDDEPPAAATQATDSPAESGENDKAAHAAALAQARVQLADRPNAFGRSEFFEMEAEMSDDDGHSGDDGDEDANADGMLAELIGNEKDKKSDEKRRAKLHAKWLEQQDAEEMENLQAAMRSGWRRRRNGLDDDEWGTDKDARRRRAALMGITEEDYDMGNFDLATLFPNMRAPEGDEDDGSADEEELADEAELRRAVEQQRILDASQDLEPEAMMERESQETLGLLRGSGSGSQGGAPPAPPPSQRPRLGLFGSELTNTPGAAASFLGKAGRGGPRVQRGASEHTNGASRSFVFGSRDDSNPAPPTEVTEGLDDGVAAGPTSFAGLRTMTFGATGGKRKRAALLGVLSKTGGAKGAKQKASPTDVRMQRALRMASCKKQ